MDKLKVEICVGTTCFIMGSSNLQDLEKYLPHEIRDKVEITGCPCLNACKSDNYGNAPFVSVGGELIANATLASITEKIRAKLP